LPYPNADADTFRNAGHFAVAEGDGVAISVAVAEPDSEWRLRHPIIEAFRFAVAEPDEVPVAFL
jgi:hypothetical protein